MFIHSNTRSFSFTYLLWLFLFSFLYVSATGLSFVWITLLFMALLFAVVALWVKDIKQVLFFGLIFTISMNISKALIVQGGVYTPGLFLTLADVFLFPLLVLWFIDKKIVKDEKIYWSKLHTFPLLMLIWLWITIIVAEDKFAAVLMCVTYTKFTLIFIFLADYIKHTHHVRLVIYGLALGACAQFAVVFIEMAIGHSIDLQGGQTALTSATKLVFENAGTGAFRPSGLTGHPNALADIMVFVLPILLALTCLGTKQIGRVAWMLSGLLLIGGGGVLILTLSRGGWISFTFAATFLLYVGYKRGAIPRKHINYIGMFAGGAMVAALLIYPTIYLRIVSNDHNSTDSRFIMMDQALMIIKRYPVMGVGMAGYNRAARENIPQSYATVSADYQEDLLEGVVHNKYLVLMAETGIVGGILFVIMLWRFVMALPREKNWSDPVSFSIALGVCSGIVGQTAFYIFDHFYVDNRIAVLYLFFGILAAMLKMQKRELIRAGVP